MLKFNLNINTIEIPITLPPNFFHRMPNLPKVSSFKFKQSPYLKYIINLKSNSKLDTNYLQIKGKPIKTSMSHLPSIWPVSTIDLTHLLHFPGPAATLARCGLSTRTGLAYPSHRLRPQPASLLPCLPHRTIAARSMVLPR